MTSNLSQFIKFLKEEISENQISSANTIDVIDPRDRLENKSEICVKPKNTKEITKNIKLANKLIKPIKPIRSVCDYNELKCHTNLL